MAYLIHRKANIDQHLKVVLYERSISKQENREFPCVTLDDPQDISNKESTKEVNSINRPQLPKEK
jgi:hypothetical protein